MTAPDLVVEADIGSATTRGRHPDHHWLVRLRRGHHTVVIDHGLTKNQADRLATRLAEIINDTTPSAPNPEPPDTPTGPPQNPLNGHHQ